VRTCCYKAVLRDQNTARKHRMFGNEGVKNWLGNHWFFGGADHSRA
jgi:hypothetical protein